MTFASDQTFYWYDYETFGINSRADRPAQFAGIRTDLDLHPVAKGEILYAKPAEDYLPNPESCLLTGITPQLCEEKGLPESDFAQAVWSRLNQPGTVSIGYNSLGFDDEVNRFLFWRNFLDPYSHGYAGGCSRWDLFPLVCATWALRGSGIRWPHWEEINPAEYPKAAGRKGVCFKLEFLTKFNGIEHGHAHDALSDVEATIGLAKLIREKEPRLWTWAFKNRTKEAVETAVSDAKPVVWVTPKFGISRGCTRIVACIHASGNDRYMWDLMHDPEILRTLPLEELKLRLFPSRADREAGVEPLPIQRLKTNASPFVCTSLKVLSPDRAAKYGIDFNAVLENHRKLLAVLPYIEASMTKALLRDDVGHMSDVDLDLYGGGFTHPADKALFREIRSQTPQTLAALCDQEKLHFRDARFEKLLLRFRARNWPETLSPSEEEAWRRFCRRRLIEGEPPYLTVTQYFEEIDRQGEVADVENEAVQDILAALYEWGEKLGDACGG